MFFNVQANTNTYIDKYSQYAYSECAYYCKGIILRRFLRKNVTIVGYLDIRLGNILVNAPNCNHGIALERVIKNKENFFILNARKQIFGDDLVRIFLYLDTEYVRNRTLFQTLPKRSEYMKYNKGRSLRN